MQDYGEFRYAAFISYRHLEQDRKWAKWVLDALESFRTPRTLLKQGYPARIGRLYRDEDENPASADLYDQVEQALTSSRTLIVIATEDTPRSQWIDREVARFKELGRGERILVVLASGNPQSSYPSPLLDDPNREPIAVDVRPRSDESHKLVCHRARLRLAAAIIGCSFDELFQRDRKRQRRRLGLLGGAAAVTTTIASTVFVAAEQRSETLRLQEIAASLNPAEPQSASKILEALSPSGWPFIKLPKQASEAMKPFMGRLAVKELSLADGNVWPVVVAPFGDEGAAVGMSDGTVHLVENGRSRPLSRGSGCADADMAFGRCAIMSLAVSGGKVVAGDRDGRVLFTDERGQLRFVVLEGNAITNLLWRDDRMIIAADLAGSLSGIAIGGPTNPVTMFTQGGGGVASLVRQEDGSVLVIRVSGAIQRLGADGVLRQIDNAGRLIRGGGFVDGKLVVLRYPAEQGGWEIDEAAQAPLQLVVFDDLTKTRRSIKIDPSGIGAMYDNGLSVDPTRRSLMLGSSYNVSSFDLDTGDKTDMAILDVNKLQNANQFDDNRDSVVRGFYAPGSLAVSNDGTLLYSISNSGNFLIIINLNKYQDIITALTESRRPRADLCALGFGFVVGQASEAARLCQ